MISFLKNKNGNAINMFMKNENWDKIKSLKKKKLIIELFTITLQN